MALFRFVCRSRSTDRPPTGQRGQETKIELRHLGTVLLRTAARRTDADRVSKRGTIGNYSFLFTHHSMCTSKTSFDTISLTVHVKFKLYSIYNLLI